MIKRLLCALLMTGCFQRVEARVKVASVFGDNMVIQQGLNAPVWGTALPGERVSVSLAGFTATGVADSLGKWMVRLPGMGYGGPYVMTVQGENELTFNNVMVGEVWLAAGQSNMEFSVASMAQADKEIAAANYPQVRCFTVGLNVSNKPLDYVQGSWKVCSPQTVASFSAVAYCFARDLWLSKRVAVGVIVAAWGGSPAEPFVSGPSLLAHPDFREKMLALQESKKDWFEIFHQYEDSMQRFRASANGVSAGVNKPAYNDHGWKDARFPFTMAALGLDKSYGNNVWFRKQVRLNKPGAGDYLLRLGKINGTVTVYVNGQEEKVAVPAQETSVFVIPANHLHSGNNVVAIHLVEMWGGSIGAVGDTAWLVNSNGWQIALNEDWKYNASLEMPIPAYVSSNTTPSTIFNGMIAPLMPYGIRGALWYQGESNTARAYQYRSLLPLLINDWRVGWQEGAFPFLVVQLANFNATQADTSGSEWAELREAQLMAMQYPNTGMAVAADIGEAGNIHPRNKQAVGHRLFLAAQHVAYHQPGVYSGPLYDHMERDGNNIILHFTQTGDGLKVPNGGPLEGFTIAGEEQRFVAASAVMEGDQVIVHSEQVLHPVAVRYGWAQSPVINLYNREGLPAVPFRTDNWQLITFKNK